MSPVLVPTGGLRIAEGDVLHTLIDFLSYLKLRGKNRPEALTQTTLEVGKPFGLSESIWTNEDCGQLLSSCCLADMGVLDSFPSSVTSAELNP